MSLEDYVKTKETQKLQIDRIISSILDKAIRSQVEKEYGIICEKIYNGHTHGEIPFPREIPLFETCYDGDLALIYYGQRNNRFLLNELKNSMDLDSFRKLSQIIKATLDNFPDCFWSYEHVTFYCSLHKTQMIDQYQCSFIKSSLFDKYFNMLQRMSIRDNITVQYAINLQGEILQKKTKKTIDKGSINWGDVFLIQEKHFLGKIEKTHGSVILQYNYNGCP